MKEQNLLAGLILAIGGLIGATAWAEGKASFTAADVNADGRISYKEATQVGVTRSEAKSKDVNNDGYLTRNDWQFVNVDSGSTETAESDEGSQASQSGETTESNGSG